MGARGRAAERGLVPATNLRRVATFVSEVNYTRNLTSDIPFTIILPFDYTASKIGGTFYTFNGVNEKWEAVMDEVAPDAKGDVHLKANTPYIIKPSAATATQSEFAFNDVTIMPTNGSNTTKAGDWVFHGTYSKMTWNEGEGDELTDKNIYGFAAASKENAEGKQIIAQGEFVRAGHNVRIHPTRAYLEYTGTDDRLRSKSTFALPDRITVVFRDHETASVIDDPAINPSENENGDISTPTSEITAPNANVKVWSYDKTIFIDAAPGIAYHIIDANGRLLRASTTQSDRDEVRLGHVSGIVIVIIGNKAHKLSN